MRTIDKYRVVDEIAIKAIPSRLQVEFFLHRQVEELKAAADFELIRPDWERFASARQGSE